MRPVIRTTMRPVIRPILRVFFIILCALTAYSYAEETEYTVNIVNSAPLLNAQLDDWADSMFVDIPLIPAIEDDKKNLIGYSSIQFAAQADKERVYFAVRWPDPTLSMIYRPWHWRGNRYRRSNKYDDMFSLRFNLTDSFDRSMLTEVGYQADVWVWSAGRSNPAGFAEDGRHTISMNYLEKAAEYELESGELIYIKREKDSGINGFDTQLPPAEKSAVELGSIVWPQAGSGSILDVSAAGQWSDGYWVVELSRLRVTADPNDRAFLAMEEVISQMAVFDQSNEEHKSVTEPIKLLFSN